MTCSCPGNNIAQALGTRTSHSQAAFRDICLGGVCQASLTLAKAGSQQGCVEGKVGSVSFLIVYSLLSPSPSSLPPLPLKQPLSHFYFYSLVLGRRLAKGESVKAFTVNKSGLRRLPSRRKQTWSVLSLRIRESCKVWFHTSARRYICIMITVLFGWSSQG